MRPLFLLLLTFLVAVPAHAEEVRQGQVQSVAGASAAYASDLIPGNQYALSCDGAVRYRTCLTSSCTAVATDAYVAGDKKLFDVCLPQGKKRIAIIVDTGTTTTTCQVYLVSPITVCR